MMDETELSFFCVMSLLTLKMFLDFEKKKKQM